jgi:YaaC-like Protein
MSSDSLYGIRATRASPPGFARDDDERREVYGAALAQFEELIAAAAVVGPGSRPLPLFYALSQAGRAIAAAHAERAWRLRWHGLSSRVLDVAPLDIEVKRAPAADDEGSVDSVTGVAAATGTEVFAKSATIGALWSSLPEVFSLLPASFETGLTPMRLALEPDPEGLHRHIDRAHVYAVAIDFDGSPNELDKELGEHYPTSIGMSAYRPFQGQPVMPVFTPYGYGLAVRWNRNAAHDAGRDQDVAALERDGWCWLRPSISRVPLSSLLTWWSLLFGLSMLARYEPAGWIRALDYESSELAAPLAKLLDIGLTRVADLTLGALVAVPEPEPPNLGPRLGAA